MRARAEIENDLTKTFDRNATVATQIISELNLEVLLDIRDLLNKNADE